MCRNWIRWTGAALFAALSWGASVSSLSAQQSPPEVKQTRTAEVQFVGEMPASPFYIGLSLDELSEQLKTQLNLAHGVVIAEVAPNSPAAKADIKRHDVLMKVGETEVRSPQDVQKAVASAGDKEVTLVMVRAGKEVTVKVTPEKRPQNTAEQANSHEGERTPFGHRLFPQNMRDQLFLFHPGVMMGKGKLKFGELPKGMSVTVEKSGAEPAKISVTKGDQNWTITEDKISELPADVRDVVERFLAGGLPEKMLLTFRGQANAPPGAAPVPIYGEAPGSPEAHESVKRAQEEVAKAQQRLAEQIHKWQEQQRREQPQFAPPIAAPGGDLARKMEEVLKRLDRGDEHKILSEMRESLKELRKEVDELKKKQ